MQIGSSTTTIIIACSVAGGVLVLAGIITLIVCVVRNRGDGKTNSEVFFFFECLILFCEDYDAMQSTNPVYLQAPYVVHGGSGDQNSVPMHTFGQQQHTEAELVRV
jgi:hypothetical protein